LFPEDTRIALLFDIGKIVKMRYSPIFHH